MVEPTEQKVSDSSQSGSSQKNQSIPVNVINSFGSFCEGLLGGKKGSDTTKKNGRNDFYIPPVTNNPAAQNIPTGPPKSLDFSRKINMRDWLTNVSHCPYKYAYDETGIAVDNANRSIILIQHINNRPVTKTYQFSDIRKWRYEIPGADLIQPIGNVGVGSALQIGILNIRNEKKAKSQTGFYIEVKDIDNPEWFIKFEKTKTVETELKRWMEIFRQHVNEQFDDAIQWNTKGLEFFKEGQYQLAINAWDRVLAQMPNNTVTWVNKGEALLGLHRFEEALISLNQALALDANNSMAWNDKGVALQCLTQYEDAIQAYDQSLALDPNNPTTLQNKINAQFKIGQYREAIDTCLKYSELEPANADAWNKLGLCAYNLKEYNMAIETYDMALTNDPNNEDIIKNKKMAVEAAGLSLNDIVPVLQETKIFCGNCGNPIKSDNKFCTSCGTQRSS